MTPEEAAEALSVARATMRRSRRTAAGAILRASLVWWGLDWMAGYTALQLWPSWVVLLAWALASLGLFVAPHRHERRAGEVVVVSGWEAQFRRSWWVVLLGSCACAIIVAPAPLYAFTLLGGALWGVAYTLYGVIAGDREIAVLGAAIVALAVVLRIVALAVATLPFGLIAGGGTVALGLVRWRRGL